MKQGWEYKKLGEVCTIERGGSPRPITDYITDSEDGINWIKIGDAQEGSKYITSTKEKIRPEGIKKSRFVHKGDFILSNSMSFGRPYILKVDGCIHDGWLVIHDDNEVFIKDYLYYILSSPIMYAKFSQLAVGGVVNNLNSSLVRKVSIPLPPKSTQLTIVSELDKINELIRLKKEQLKDCDNLAQSIFYEMFGDPVENDKGWEVKKLGEIGIVKTGNTPARSNERFYNENFIEWIKTDNIRSDRMYPTTAAEYLSKEGAECGRIVSKDSILVACIAGSISSIGKCCITTKEVAFNQQINAITPNKDLCNSIYLYKLIVNSSRYIQQNATTGMKHILSKSIFEQIQISLPPLLLQHLFAQRIEQIERQKSAVQKSITDLETLLASRMQYWFE